MKRIGIIAIAAIIALSTAGCEQYDQYFERLRQREEHAAQSESVLQERSFSRPLEEAPDPEFQPEWPRFYYSRLSREEQEAYTRIYSAILHHKESAPVTMDDEDRLTAVFAAVLDDHPELFWKKNELQWQSTPVAPGTYYLEFTYTHTPDEVEALQQRLAEYESECFSVFDSTTTDYEKVLRVYDYIIDKTVYDLSAPNNQSLASLLESGRSVCAGYARMTQYLLNRLGIETVYVPGEADTPGSTSSEGHAWNMLLLGGEYYHLDTTWGDMEVVSEASWLPELRFYDYFLLTDDEIRRTHTPVADYRLPTATGQAYNYYRYGGRLLDTYDEQRIGEIISADLAGGSYSTFRFGDRDSYEAAKEHLFQQNGIYTFLGADVTQTNYYLNDNLFILTVCPYSG